MLIDRSALVWLVLAALVLGVLVAPSAPAEANALSRVYLNGHVVPVSFNDGDSFRVRGGEFEGSQCRLTGYNTLESFGPAHQWGGWHPYELYIVAKQATYNGRRGTWHCFTEGNRDTYGRLLVECPDLVVDQIRRGYGHAYNANDTPSRPEYLRAQQEAIAARRGIWAHGVPGYIMTSVHSFSEDTSREWHYNRMISTRDGHSESVRHRESYGECQWVCSDEIVADEPAVERVAETLRSDPALAPGLTDFSNLLLMEVVARFARIGSVPEYFTGPAHDGTVARLEAARAAGTLPATHTRRAACMLYVAFERRYGSHRADCLRGHGTLPPGVDDVWHLDGH